MPALRTATRRFFCACLFLPAPAFADCTMHAYGAIAADLVSTRIALENGAREGNPLYGSAPGNGTLLVAGLVRAGFAALADRYAPEANCIIARGTYAVAVGNLAVAAGVRQPAALGLGIAVTVPFW